MKKIFVLVLLFLCGCSRAQTDTEVQESTKDILTTEVTTQEPIMFTAEPREEVTEQQYTKESFEMEFEIIEMTSEEGSIDIQIGIEDSTGEVDVNGYGWVQLQYSAVYNITDNHLTKSNGSLRFNGHRETWYSTNEPGQTVTARDIPGKHVADDGTIRDENGYICVATDQNFYRYGEIVMTSVGPGKVYDCGCSYGTVDVYTNW